MSSKSKPTNEEIITLLFIIAPQFETSDPIILEGYNSLINALECMINYKVLGCCATLAYANLLAHFLTMQSNSILGVASSMSEGQLSIGIANTTGGNYFGSTPYGQTYSAIIGKFRIGAYVTNSIGYQYGPACGC